MPRLQERRRGGSEVSHVLFREQDGWTADEARSWLQQHDFRRFGDVEHVVSDGGEKLAPGDYLVYRVASPAKIGSFTSFGYSDEMEGGVWFKFGGYRKARSKLGAREATDWRDLVEPSDGMFVFQAALWCNDDALLIRQELEKEGDVPEDPDSDQYPDGPYPPEESDSPDHCDAGEACVNAIELPYGGKIGQWLGNDLTSDGIDYVCSSVLDAMDSASEHKRQVNRLWRHLYAAQIDDCLAELHPIAQVGGPETPSRAISAVVEERKRGRIIANGLWTDGDYIYVVAVERKSDGDVFVMAFEAQPDGTFDQGDEIFRMSHEAFQEDFSWATGVKDVLIAVLEDAGWR